MTDIWRELEFEENPIFIVGRRKKPGELEAFVVNLSDNTADELRKIAMTTVEIARHSTTVEWRPNMVLESEQVAVLDGDLLWPRRSFEPFAEVDEDDAAVDGIPAAELLRLLNSTRDLETLAPEVLDTAEFRFYAIIWPSGFDGDVAAFVREVNPVSIRRQSKTFYYYDDLLELARTPDFMLDQVTDLIVTSDSIFILRTVAFDRLFADVRSSLNDVEASVSALQDALPRLPFSAISLRAIRSVCAIKPTYARRLQDLAEAQHIKSITPALLKRALEIHGADPHDFIRAGTVEIDRDEVGELLDVLEGRWYEADFSMEPRRAGRWTRRSSRPARKLGDTDSMS